MEYVSKIEEAEEEIAASEEAKTLAARQNK
jgi:hypothetical protein